MRLRDALLFVLLLIFTALSLSAREPGGRPGFAPRSSEVTAADENLAEKNISLEKKRASSLENVDNGFQGGAFLLIRFFQEAVSPQDGPNCRFHPVCSAYGRQAVVKHGAFWGAVLAGERLLRCNPWSRPGADPVPRKKPFGD